MIQQKLRRFRVHIATTAATSSMAGMIFVFCEDCREERVIHISALSGATCARCDIHDEANEEWSRISLLEEHYRFAALANDDLRRARYKTASRLKEWAEALPYRFEALDFGDVAYLDVRELVCRQNYDLACIDGACRNFFGSSAYRDPPLALVQEIGRRAMELFRMAECRLLEELQDPEPLLKDQEEIRDIDADAEIIGAMLRMLPSGKVSGAKEVTLDTHRESVSHELSYGDGYELHRGEIFVVLDDFGKLEAGPFWPSVACAALLFAILERIWSEPA